MKIPLSLSVLPIAAAVSIGRRQMESGHSHGSSGMGGIGGLGGLGSLTGSLPQGLLSGVSGLMTMFMQSQKAMKIEELQPLVRKDAKRIRVTYGPYKLKGRQSKESLANGFSMDPAGTGYMYRLDTDFPRDITILYAESGAYDEKMKPIDINDGLYNHHNVFIDTSQPPPAILSCGDGQPHTGIPMSFFIRGTADLKSNRYTTSDGSFKSGFYIAKNAPLMQMIDIVNYNNETRTVYTVSEVEYLPGKQEGFLQSISTGIDMGMCTGRSGIDVHAPKGVSKFSLKGKDMIFERNGYILNAWGHLHDGGVDMEVRLNGKVICLSKAEYGGPGHESEVKGEVVKTISGMTLCSNATEVAKGDKLSITANFDVDAHPAREQSNGRMAEGMALLGTTFAIKQSA